MPEKKMKSNPSFITRQLTPMNSLSQLLTRRIARSLLLCALCLGVMAPPALGQMDIKPGIKVGGNLASLGGDDAQLLFQLGGQQQEIPIDRRSGFMVGGFAVVDLAGPIALQPELLYVQKGAKTEIDFGFQGQTQTITSTLKLSYIQLPVLAKFQIPVSGPVSPNVFAGPNVGFNISATNETEGGGESESEDVEGVSGTDYGLTIGAGADFGLSLGTVTVDLRYELGLANLPEEGEASIKNRGIGITAGLVF